MTKKKQPTKNIQPLSTAERYCQEIFVLNEKQIEGIYELIKNIGSIKPKIKIECTDGISHEFSHLKSLFSYENPKSSRIKTLRISNKHGRFRASTEEGFLNGIQYTIGAPNDKIYETHKRIEALIEGTRPWYTFIAKQSFFLIAIAMIIVGLLVDEWLNATDKFIFENNMLKTYFWTVIIGCSLLGFLKEKFFTNSSYLIGQEKERYNHFEAIRWSIIIPTIIALIVGSLFMFIGN